MSMGGALLKEQTLVALCLLVEVKVPRDRGVGPVQLAPHAHHPCELVRVVRVGLVGVWDKARDLPPALWVLKDKGVVYAELACGLEGRDLSGAIDEQLGAHAGVTVDPLPGIGRKVAREIGESLLEGVDVTNLLAGAPEHAHDVVKDLGVNVVDELRVKALDLGEGVKLVDDALGVAPDLHVE